MLACAPQRLSVACVLQFPPPAAFRHIISLQSDEHLKVRSIDFASSADTRNRPVYLSTEEGEDGGADAAVKHVCASRNKERFLRSTAVSSQFPCQRP